MRPPSHAAIALLLVPLSWLYGAAVRIRNRVYDRRGASRRAGVPVLCVGNLAAGGTGKTPMVAWLVRRLRAEGLHPAVVTRGYGGRAGKGPLVVSSGGPPRVAWDVAGDEPLLLARALEGVPVVAGSDRAAGAAEAVSLGADVVVLDDGFQHRRLARDLDLVLLDSRSPFGRGLLLPAGSLREPPSALRRASAVILTRCRPGERLPGIESAVGARAPGVPILRAGHRRAGFVDGEGREVARPAWAVAFCGIANPVPFLSDLEEEGVEVSAARVFADHHPYTAREIAGLARLASKYHASLVTTDKDLVRLPAGSGLPLVALRIEAVVHDEERLMRLVREAIAGGRA